MDVKVPVITDKVAPAKIHQFIAEQLLDLAVQGKVLSVLVDKSAYLVTLSLPEHGVASRHLSAYDVGRSLRGDRDALAVIRADLLRGTPAGVREAAPATHA